MKYERLTDKNDLYWALQEAKLSAEVGIYLTDCLNRLAELEDKKEQGTLIELPCKLGATIFCVTENSIVTRTAFSFEISSLSRYIKTTMGDILSCDAIGKYIFLTREEAEKCLKEKQV